MSTTAVSSDSQVILLICTQLALPRRESELKPLSRSEWNDVARAIDASSFKRPGALLGADASSLAGNLNIEPALAERIAALLARGGQLAIELECLFRTWKSAVCVFSLLLPGRVKVWSL